MNFDPTSLSNFILILTAWVGAFIAALWLSLVIWTYRDIRSRARDVPTRILAVLVVAVLFLPGIVIYLILRPHRTLVQEYQNTLEEEALLQSIEESALCPGCGRRIKDQWVVCPNCHTKLKKTCQKCGELMELPWNLCPFCATPTPGMIREDLSLEDVLSQIPIAEENDQAELSGELVTTEVEAGLPTNDVEKPVVEKSEISRFWNDLNEQNAAQDSGAEEPESAMNTTVTIPDDDLND